MTKIPNKPKKHSEVKAEVIQERSPADFFNENKAIAGFDNTMRVVFTSVRELVENALDASEKIGNLPEVEIEMQLLSEEEISKLLNVKFKRKGKNIDFLRLRVKDNGLGVPANQVPLLFGRVLTGSNYGARQSRGRFGLGAKMVLLNAMSTVDLPITVKSRHFLEEETSLYHLFIDLQKNEPIVVGHDGKKSAIKGERFGPDHLQAFPSSGTEVTVTFTGSWNLAKRYVTEYFYELAMVTPYASLKVSLPEEEPIVFERVVDEMPPYPVQSKIHPWGTDITQLKKEIAFTKNDNLVDFFINHFAGFRGKKMVQNFCDFVKLAPTMNPKQLSASDIRRIVHEGFRRAKVSKSKKLRKKEKTETFSFIKPSGKSLSPLGAHRLRRGIEKILMPKFVETVSMPVNAYSGHSFIVEGAIAYGSPELSGDDEIKLYRYANRIPLLFGQGNDVVSKVIFKSSAIDWKTFKINPQRANCAITISIVSTKIPFPETSKEYLADVEEIREDITKVLISLGRKVRTFLGKAERARRTAARESEFARWSPRLVADLITVIQDRDDLPFDPITEQEKIINALSEGRSKFVQYISPCSIPIYQVKTWLDPNIKIKLQQHKVLTVSDFLYTSTNDLAKITGLSEERVDEIKSVSVHSLDLDPNSPQVTTLNLISTRIEKGLKKSNGSKFLKVGRALSRRWISTVYDFFSADLDHLFTVNGLIEKSYEQLKEEVCLFLLKDERIRNKVGLNQNKWFNEETIEDFTKIGINSILELLYCFEGDMGKCIKSFLVDAVKNHLQRFPDLLKQEISVDSVKRDAKVLSDANSSQTEFSGKWPFVPILEIDSETEMKRLFSWMSGEIRRDLSKVDLKKWTHFVSAQTSELIKIKSLVSNLIRQLKEEFSVLLEDKILPFPLSEVFENEEWQVFVKKLKNEKVRISTVSQEINSVATFLLSSYNDVNLDKLKKVLINRLEKKALKYHNSIRSDKENLAIDISKLVWIPSDIKEVLLNLEIKTAFDFLKTPRRILNDIPKLSKELISDIKTNMGIPLNYLNHEFRERLKDIGIETTEELIFHSKSEFKKDKDLWKDVEGFRETLSQSIVFLPKISSKSFKDLYALGITNIAEFLIWDIFDLQKAGLEPATSFLIKNTFNLEEIEEMKSRTEIPLQQLPFLDEEIIELLIKNGISSIQSFYYSKVTLLAEKIDHSLKKEENSLEDCITNLNRAKVKLEYPVTFIPSVSHKKIFELVSNGINRIIDYLSWNPEELAEIMETDIEKIFKSRNSLDSLREGVKISDMSVFIDILKARTKHNPIKGLQKAGIDYIDQIYFSLTDKTFGIEKVDWKKIKVIKQKLDMPTAMLLVSEDGEEEVSDKPLKPAILERMADSNINTMIEFISCPDDDLAKIMKSSVAKIKKLKQSLKIKEEGFYLDNFEILDPKLIKHMEAADLETVEDLYFSLSPESFENPDVLKRAIFLKKALDTPLVLLPEFSEGKTAEILAKNQITKLIRFFMIVNEDLATILEVPVEKIVVLKGKINLEKVAEQLDVPLTLMKGIDSNIAKMLALRGIQTILDFMAEPTYQLANYLKISANKIEKLRSSVNVKQIEKTMAEKLTPVSQIFKLSKSEVDKLSSKGIKYIIDLAYKADKELVGENLWEKIKPLKGILSLPVRVFQGFIPKDFTEPLLLLSELTVADLFLKEATKLAKQAKTKTETIFEIRKTLDLNNFVESLSLPVSTIQLTHEAKKLLVSKGLSTVLEVLTASKDELSEIGLLDDQMAQLKSFITNFSLKNHLSSLDVPLELVLADLSDEELLKLRRVRIKTIYDFLVTTPDKLARYLNRSLDEMQIYVDNISFKEASEILNSSIIYLPVLSGKAKKTLIRSGIERINQASLLTDNELSTKAGITKKSTKLLKKELSLAKIQEHQKSMIFSFPDRFSDVLTQRNIPNDVLFVYLKNKDEHEVSIPSEILTYIKKLSGSVLQITNITRTDLRRLYQAKIETIFEFYYWPCGELGSLLDLTEEKVKEMKNEIDLEEESTTEVGEEALISSFTTISDRFKAKLSDMNIKTLTDLSLIPTDQISSLEESIANQLNKLKESLESPVCFLSNLKSIEKIKLHRENLKSVNDFLLAEESVLESILGWDKQKITDFKKDIDFFSTYNYKMKRGIKVSFFQAFPESIASSLEGKGFSCMEDIFYILSQSSVSPKIWKSVESFKDSFGAPITFLTTIRDKNPEFIAKIEKFGAYTIAEFLVLSTTEISKILDVEDKIARRMRFNLNFSKVKKGRKKQGTSLTALAGSLLLKEEQIDALRKYSIFSIEDLYYLSKIKPLPEELISPEYLKKFVDTMNKPAKQLDQMPITKAPVLEKKHINRVIDFIYWPKTDIRSRTKLSFKDISEIKERIRVLTNEEIKKKLDSLLFGGI